MALLSLWLGYTTHRARQQRQVVDAILAVGGEVRFIHERQDDGLGGSRAYDPKLQPNVPTWLLTTLGPDYFRKVISVSLVDAPVTDDWLAQVDKLPSPDALSLRRTNVTGQGIARLRRLSQLEQLVIPAMANVTDETLRAIGKASNMEYLVLTDCGSITDQGLQHLSQMTELKTLMLGGTNVTDEGLAHLAHLKELYWLSLSGTKVSDAGLHHLEGLTKLQHLVLWDTQVTPEAAKRLQSQLPSLRRPAIGLEPKARAPSPLPMRPERGRGR
jgi:hypothetical protein